MLIEFKLLLNSLREQSTEVLELVLSYLLSFAWTFQWLAFVLLLFRVFFLHGCGLAVFVVPVQSNLFEEALNLFVVVLPEVSLVAFYFDVILLHRQLLLFALLSWAFLFASWG